MNILLSSLFRFMKIQFSPKIQYKGLSNYYFTLRLPFFDLPNPPTMALHHFIKNDHKTRLTLCHAWHRYPLYHLCLFFEVEKKKMIRILPWHIHWYYPVIEQSNSFWLRASLHGRRAFLVDCLLCLSLHLSEFFDLQFGLWFSFNLMIPK